MQEKKNKISPERAPKVSPKIASGYRPRYKMALSAIVCEVRRTTTFRAVDEVTRSITLELRDCKKGRVIPFSFHMEKVEEARAFQRLLGGLNFSLESERDINVACRHVLGATCSVWVGVNCDGPDGNEFKALDVQAAKNQLNPVDEHCSCWT